MSVKRVEFTYKRKELRKDPATGLYIGWQIDIRGTGGKRHRNTFATKQAAEAFIDALKKRKLYNKAGLPYTPTHAIRLSKLLARRIEIIPHPKEVVRARRVFAAFESIFDHDPLVTDIRTVHFQKFINERTETVSPESVNREMTLLRTAFARASEMFPEEMEGYEPPKIPRPRFKQRRRERIITAEENTAILTHLYTPVEGENEKQSLNRLRIARMWQMGWLLGLRYGEIEKLKKSDYDGQTLRVMRWKTGDVTVFEDLPDEVHTLLREAIDASETDYIFTLNGSPPRYFYQILKKAAESAGLKWGRETVDSITFHNLRHSFVTRLIQVTDPATAKHFTAHSDETMVMLYSHATNASRKAAMQAMYGASTDKLTEIYERVRSGKMTLEEFLKAF
jgi:integrase